MYVFDMFYCTTCMNKDDDDLRAFRTYKSVVMDSYISEHSELTSQWLCTHVSHSSQNLQVSSYVLMYLRAVTTYNSVVMYPCISEHSELTSQ